MTFPTALATALARRALTGPQLARLLHTDPTVVHQWLTGKRSPRIENATAVAELLDAPELARIVVTSRTRRCVVCAGTFVSNENNPGTRRYCGDPCKSTALNRRRMDARASVGRLDRNRLRDHQQAVAAFCRDCTQGEGLCRDAECSLRPVSPMAFVPLAVRRAA